MDSLQEQFGLIYDQYIDKIYRFVYLKVNSEEHAEDITSKVFTRGWEAYKETRNSKSEIRNMGAFLYQIARNAVVDHYRERDKHSTVSAELVNESKDLGKNALENAVLTADINVLKTAINKLKKEHQDALIWRYLEDMPIGEIAVLLGKTEGSVRVMLHRGLKELKGLIQEN